MPKTYNTISGDMWDMIAKKTLGSEMHTDALIKANIKHRHIFIFPYNIRLTIPDIPTRTPGGLEKYIGGG